LSPIRKVSHIEELFKKISKERDMEIDNQIEKVIESHGAFLYV